MKRQIKSIFLVVYGLAFFGQLSSAQTKANLDFSESKVIIKGTSSLHDWEVKATDFKVSFPVGKDKESLTIGQVNAVFPGNSIISDNSIMTGKIREALKVKDFPEIIFHSEGLADLVYQDGSIKGTIKGDLNIAGVTKKIDVSFLGKLAGSILSIEGSQEINMKDYNIKSPTAMMGALKTGDKVTLEFTLQFSLVQ